MRGSLKKRSKNSWTIILSLGRDPATGKRRQQWVSVKGTKKDAEQRLAELLHELDTGGFVRPTRVTVGEFLQQWLMGYAATNVRPRTFEGYRTIVERRLIPGLGNILLSQLGPAHLQTYYTKTLTGPRLDGKPGSVSARTVLHHHRVLSEALSHAVRWGLVARNVAQAVDPPRPESHEMKTLDTDGVRTLLETAKDTGYYPIIHLAVYTGLRRSELLGLRWKDVDLDMATVSVAQVMHRLQGGSIIFQEPKTRRARRMVALPPAAVLVLRAHRETQEAIRAILGNALANHDLVFSRADGSPISPNTLSDVFRRILSKAKIPFIRFHDLRHTHASLMLRQGVHPKVVSERLGHATVSITLDTYSHVTPGIQEAAALKFEEGLSGATFPNGDVSRVTHSTR
jgi:integrase